MTPDISNLKGQLRMNRFLLTTWPERLHGVLREKITELEIELMKENTMNVDELKAALAQTITDISALTAQMAKAREGIAACGDDPKAAKRKSGLKGSNVRAGHELSTLQNRKEKIEHELAGDAHDGPNRPFDGLPLVCLRPFQNFASGQKYKRGDHLPLNALGKNWSTLMSKRDGKAFAEFQPPMQAAKSTGTPCPLPTPAPGRGPNPKVELINIAGDIVASRRETLAHMTRLCGGNEMLARDLLAQDDAGSRQYLHAQRVDAENRAIAAGTYGRRVISAAL